MNPEIKRIIDDEIGVIPAIMNKLTIVFALLSAGAFVSFGLELARLEQRHAAHVKQLDRSASDYHSVLASNEQHRSDMQAELVMLRLGPSVLFLVLALLSKRGERRFADPIATRAHEALVARKHHIVWVYAWEGTQVVDYRLGGATVARDRYAAEAVWIGYDNGDLISIPPVVHGAKKLVEHLADEVPWCTVGYREDLLSAFKNDPASLRRSTQRA